MSKFTATITLDTTYTGSLLADLMDCGWQDQAGEIRKQIPIEEPTQWGVVRDNAGFDWIRTGTTLTSSKEWRSTDHGTPVDWAEIDGPTLIREGV
jgi:hypothetical protein